MKSAEVWIADLDWPLIRSWVPNNYPLLLRDTTAPMFARWLREKAPLCDLVLLSEESSAFPDEGGVLEVTLAGSFQDVIRGVSHSGGPAHAVVQVKRYGLHMIEVRVDCRDARAESACAELVLGIERHWPGTLGRMKEQIDHERQRKWSELDRELTLLLIGDENEGTDRLKRDVRGWLNRQVVGVRWVLEEYGPTVEVRLKGKEGTLWRIACGMTVPWPALEPKVGAKLSERMQDGLEERLSKNEQRYLHQWLAEHPPKTTSSIPRDITGASAARRMPTSNERQAEEKPWEEIPDLGYDRKMLEFWIEGYTAKEIGAILDRKPGTILNRLTKLRDKHGEEIVPYKRPP